MMLPYEATRTAETQPSRRASLDGVVKWDMDRRRGYHLVRDGFLTRHTMMSAAPSADK
jgi:hypothetical protein